MKRITFALCIILISLSTMAQGTLQERLKGNPKIDSLVSKVAALGGSGQVSYYYDGKLHKTVSIFCSLMNDFEPTPPTGDSQRDTRNQKMDSVRKERCEQGNRIYNIVRNTCKALTDEAKESYTWEYHRNGVDSVRYTIALGEYQSGDTMQTWQRQREVQYYGAPEIITFRYDPLANSDGSPLMSKGFGHFHYEYTPDSVWRQMKDLVPFNKAAYTALLQPILKQKGITTRQFIVNCDSTYTFEKESWTIRSKELADSVLSLLIRTTWTFLENNPDVSFHFEPYAYYGIKAMNELFENLDYRRVMGFYHIYLHAMSNNEYNIVFLEGTGDMMIPMEWLILKSWKNGKVVYDKKRMKEVSPKQARSYTSGHRFTQTRQYEPID